MTPVHYSYDDMYHMAKQAMWSGLFKGMGKAFGAATRTSGGWGTRVNAAKDAFRQSVGNNRDALELGRLIWHTPQRAFGPTFHGDFGYGGGAKFLGRRLFRANGTYDSTTGKWMRDATKDSASDSWFTRMGNKIYDFGARNSKAIQNSTKAAEGSADYLRQHGHAALGWSGKNLGGMMGVGLGLPIAAGIGADAAFGSDSMVAKGVNGAGDLAMMPARFLNPFGLALEGVSAGASKVVDFKNDLTRKALQGAEEAARTTADQIASGIQNQGRAAHLYGALDPNGFAAKIREQASAGIKDRMAEEYAKRGLEYNG